MLYLFCCTREDKFQDGKEIWNLDIIPFLYSKFIPPSKFTTPPHYYYIVFVKRARLLSGFALFACADAKIICAKMCIYQNYEKNENAS